MGSIHTRCCVILNRNIKWSPIDSWSVLVPLRHTIDRSDPREGMNSQLVHLVNSIEMRKLTSFRWNVKGFQSDVQLVWHKTTFISLWQIGSNKKLLAQYKRSSNRKQSTVWKPGNRVHNTSTSGKNKETCISSFSHPKQ